MFLLIKKKIILMWGACKMGSYLAQLKRKKKIKWETCTNLS